MTVAETPISDYQFERFLQDGKLMGVRCTECKTLFVPPRVICMRCHSSDMEWVEMKGEGRLVAFTCISIGTPAMIEEGYNRNNPYCSGAVELIEGPRVVGRIEGVDTRNPETIKVGTPMKAAFLQQGVDEDRKTVLGFMPADESCE